MPARAAARFSAVSTCRASASIIDESPTSRRQAAHCKFMDKWKLEAPLHSTRIRGRRGSSRGSPQMRAGNVPTSEHSKRLPAGGQCALLALKRIHRALMAVGRTWGFVWDGSAFSLRA